MKTFAAMQLYDGLIVYSSKINETDSMKLNTKGGSI